MASIIDSVADMTGMRDRDELEITLATVMFELVGATALILWELLHRQHDTILRERVRIRVAGPDMTAPTDALVDMPDLPLSGMRAELRDCIALKEAVRLPPDESGLCGHLFPVSDGRNVFRLLEILSDAPLHEDQVRLIFGFLRIYRNHLGILNYGDRDELTGLLNRRTFDASFKQIVRPEAVTSARNAHVHVERRRVESASQQSHLAVIDIDFFKRINDQFGHPYGDEVLMLLARLIVGSFRDSDHLFRFGGEEFLIILKGADADGAALTLERFRTAVEAFKFPQVGQVTVSIGFTEILPADMGSDAFGRADESLYVAKHQGRNQVRCYETLIAEGTLRVRTATDQDVELF